MIPQKKTNMQNNKATRDPFRTARPRPLSRTEINALLTPWSTVLEKLTDFQIVKKFPAFYGWNPKVNYRNYKCPPLVPILSQLDPVHTQTSHLPDIHLNIDLTSMSGSPKRSPSLMFTHLNSAYASPLPHTRHMPRPSHSSRFYHPNKTG